MVLCQSVQPEQRDRHGLRLVGLSTIVIRPMVHRHCGSIPGVPSKIHDVLLKSGQVAVLVLGIVLVNEALLCIRVWYACKRMT